MKRIPVLLLSLFCLQAMAQKNKPNINFDARFKGLDTAINHALKTWHAAGVAVAVVYKDKVIYAQGFGKRDVAGNLPVTPNTLFAIGSCSKAFTATLIGKLQQDGKLDIDKPVNTVLPALKFYNDAMNNSITLRDMMSHRTGLPRHDVSWYYFPTTSRDSMLQRIKFQEPVAAVRQIWNYNNFMFMAQGVVAEKLSGKTWEENIKEKFFGPLDMKTANTTIEELEKSKEPATGYEVYHDSVIRKMTYYHINAMAPAGAINSSVTDMANWVITWINNGKFKGKEIIPANYYTQAISSQMVVSAGLPTKKNPDVYFANYGFGWFLDSYKGHYRVEHGGHIDGFSASTSFFPADSIGIVVLSNQNQSNVPSIVRNLISDRLLNNKYFDWNGDAKKAYDKAKADAKKAEKTEVKTTKSFPATHAITDYAGVYSNGGYGTIRAFVVKDSLFAATPNKTFWMRHKTYDTYNLFENSKSAAIDTSSENLTVQFQLNVTGDVESLSTQLESGLKPIVFTKGLEEKAIIAADIQKYIGDYQLSGIVAKVYVKNGKTLYAFVPGQPEYELVPVDKDKFGIKVLSGYFLKFELDAAGKVTHLLFIQPNGNYKAEKK
ncbi:serine hydrolase [Mucilaginibacter sp. RB4R14]|uniref:serine hydrolase n=1 Tax=Mucilaginibacter aurantiaciroseus TaxID=2949308 RepID=UPI002090E15F|nr:serine hydrolase [Mucilaginibacter aurantiaciroseus]MCO5934906.1 serine hydrolase [Mucilaginibacter aurantiaciroseus]